MAFTRDNLHLSEPILDVAALERSRSATTDAGALDPTVQELLEAAAAPNTRRAYESDLRHFQAWGGSIPASPELVARYLAHHARTLTVATLARRLVAIRRAHALEGLQDPTVSPLVRQTFRGLRRVYGRPQRRVAALTAEELGVIVSSLGQSTRDVRDRALLLVGFAGAFRRSELVAIDVRAIEWTASGVGISLYRSKTDQEWRGRKVDIPYSQGSICPVAAVRCWLELSGITDGPVFRAVTKGGQIRTDRLSGGAIAAIVKQHVQMVGLDPALYSGHSLRAGFATSAATAGVPMWKIKIQTGHASDAVLSRYIRAAHAFSSYPAGSCLEADNRHASALGKGSFRLNWQWLFEKSRAPNYESGGQESESLRARQKLHPDAHSTDELDLTHWGVEMAREGGVPADRVLNCRDLSSVSDYLNSHRRSNALSAYG